MVSHKLLTRDEFRKRVFERDNYKCVMCKQQAVDAHHIIDRKCWNDGGYYLANGVSLCEYCHWYAEIGELDPETLRSYARVPILLPKGWDPQTTYDKWGKTLEKIIYKYPKTMHLPWSDKLQNDDRLISSLDAFIGQEVVVTEKMDGENTSLYCDYIHTRSPSPMAPHPSRNRIKELHARVARDIPEGFRICGENLYAEHSIHYTNLPGYFMVFSIWERDICLSWDDTVEYAALLDLPHVPVLYRGAYEEEQIKSLYTPNMWERSEGYVIRVASSFRYEDFGIKVAKYVRANHVQTDQHWLRKAVVPNELRDGVW